MSHQFPSFQLKRSHEKDVAEKLTNLLYPEVVFQRFGNDQGEPDVIFSYNDSMLGVEITTAYYEDIVHLEEIKNSQDIEKKMCDVVNKMVLKKSTRRYHGVDKAILCIEALDPIKNEFPMVQCLLNLQIPEHHPFSEIYVLSYAVEGGEYQIFKIFPEDK